MNNKLMTIIALNIFFLGVLIGLMITNGFSFLQFEFIELRRLLYRSVLILPLALISIVLIVLPLFFTSKKNQSPAKKMKLSPKNKQFTKELAETGQVLNSLKPTKAISLQPRAGDNWSKLVEECVNLFEEIDRNKQNFDDSRLDLAEHFTDRIREILEISDVEVISGETQFDCLRHQPEGTTSTSIEQGSKILKTLSPGFAVDKRVIRRAKVRVI